MCNLLMVLLTGYALFWLGFIVLGTIWGAALEVKAAIGQICRRLRKRG